MKRKIRSLARRAGFFARRSASLMDEESTRERYSSAPFVSGDTFRAMADVVFENGEVTHLLKSPPIVFFATGADAREENFLKRLSSNFDISNFETLPKLIIHNDDIPLSESRVDELLSFFSRIYLPNFRHEHESIEALPLGVENAYLAKNGKLHRVFKAGNMKQNLARSNQVLSTFHVETNPSTRREVAKILQTSRHGHRESFLKLGDYWNLLASTKFVISPPGRGPDCHRTWESIYAGAVPVVLTGTMHPSLLEELPVLAVSSYLEFTQLSDEELNELFLDIRRKESAKIWASYWYRRILS